MLSPPRHPGFTGSQRGSATLEALGSVFQPAIEVQPAVPNGIPQ